MTETNKRRDLVATLRDALQKLEVTLSGSRGRGSTRSPARPNASGRGSKRCVHSGSARPPLSG